MKNECLPKTGGTLEHGFSNVSKEVTSSATVEFVNYTIPKTGLKILRFQHCPMQTSTASDNYVVNVRLNGLLILSDQKQTRWYVSPFIVPFYANKGDTLKIECSVIGATISNMTLQAIKIYNID